MAGSPFLSQPGTALLTDLYQLTMAYGYWKLGRGQQQSVFHLFFRTLPFGGGFAVTAGQELVLDYIENFSFEASDLEYLARLEGNDGKPLFEAAFLDDLAALRLTCDIDGMPEGTVAFANQPILRVQGPILHCQLLETALLNLINFSTLVATKAARVCGAAGNDAVLEFGLRRAQGPDGGVTASRAAYIGGCAATSNLLAGKLYGIPVKGTHAHSWVMSFDDEREAFDRYAEVMPNNCVFLVDTYNTLEGVRRATVVGDQLREAGHEMVGVRLDSGDLAYLSRQARRILDEAGFPRASIVASNDLDETIIESLKRQGARIDVWGVGTKLATAYDQPALGGVYKLGAIRDPQGTWQPKLKRSEQLAKTTIPGILQVKRFSVDHRAVADMIYDVERDIDPRNMLVDPKDRLRRRPIELEAEGIDLLVPLVRDGQVTVDRSSLDVIRQRVRSQIASFDLGIQRLLHPHEYPAGMDIGLSEVRDRMIEQMGQVTSKIDNQ